ncbi:MAG: hypothetical protein ACJ798_15220, partial [Phenylobacterium sp.]
GDAFQGIFVADQATTMHYQNMTITNNLVDGSGYGGIMGDHIDNSTISGNVLISRDGPQDRTEIGVYNSANLSLSNNQAVIYGTTGDTFALNSNNALNSAVSDGGAAALRSWLAAHPTTVVTADQLIANLTGAVTTGATGAVPLPIDFPLVVPPVVVAPVVVPSVPDTGFVLPEIHISMTDFRLSGFDWL